MESCASCSRRTSLTLSCSVCTNLKFCNKSCGNQHMFNTHNVGKRLQLTSNEWFETSAVFLTTLSESNEKPLLLYGTDFILERLDELEVESDFETRVAEITMDRKQFMKKFMQQLNSYHKGSKDYETLMGMILTPQLTKQKFIKTEQLIQPHVKKLLRIDVKISLISESRSKAREELYDHLMAIDEKLEYYSDYNPNLFNEVDEMERNIQVIFAIIGEPTVLSLILLKLIQMYRKFNNEHEAMIRNQVQTVGEIVRHIDLANWGLRFEMVGNFFHFYKMNKEIRDLNDAMWFAMVRAMNLMENKYKRPNVYMEKINDDTSPFITVPKGTVFYRGFGGTDPSRSWNAPVLWFAFDIYITIGYAYDVHHEMTVKGVCEGLGQIIVAETNHDLILPNMKNIDTVARIQSEIKDPEVIKAFQESFFVSAGELQRQSISPVDKTWARWLCKNKYSGYIANAFTNLAAEVALCDVQHDLTIVGIYPIKKFGMPFCDPLYHKYPLSLATTQTLNVGFNQKMIINDEIDQLIKDLWKQVIHQEEIGGKRKLNFSTKQYARVFKPKDIFMHNMKRVRITIVKDPLTKEGGTLKWGDNFNIEIIKNALRYF